VAVCDRVAERAAHVAEAFGASATYARHDELLDRERPDLLTVCTMPDTHRSIVVDAVEAGANVLCEKPLAMDLDDARAMVQAADRAGRSLAVGFNHRYMSAVQAVRAFVEDGRLGTPICARGSMLETEIPWWGPHHIREISGGGAIAATAVHMIDLLIWLAGNPNPVTATASMATVFPRKRGTRVPDTASPDRYSVEDLAFGHVRFESGFWLTIEGSWVWDEPGWDCRFTLVGDRAQANVGSLQFWTARDGELVDITGEASGDLDFPSSMRREMADVVAAVCEGRPPLASGVQALRVQAVVDALYRSAATGREVDVEATP
jgi:predicted dehydrogenase